MADPREQPLEHWRAFLEQELDCDVQVVFTRARKTPIRVRPLGKSRRGRRASGLEVRMHAFFDGAPPEVQRAVASWIRSGQRAPRACRVLDAWIEAGLERLPAAPVRPGALETRGARYDLQALFDELLACEFAGDRALHERRPGLTWGRRAPSRSRGSLRLGSYDADLNRIRLHPVLDQEAVPDWLVRYVVFHECLHALYPPRRSADGRWIHHGRELRRRERLYADHRRVLAWEKLHLAELVRSARAGRPMAAADLPDRPRAPRRALRILQSLLFPG